MKRILCMMLAFVLLLTCLPVLRVSAAEEGQKPTRDLNASEPLLSFIKIQEGFSAVPYWDNHQYSVGYGCFAGTNRDDVPAHYWDGISKEEAEALLRKEVAEKYEKPVKGFAARNKIEFTQCQFDALVSFTYNLGESWTSNSKLAFLLSSPKENQTEMKLVEAMGAWCRSGSPLSCTPGLCRRRIDEARMFLYGDYTGTKSQQYYYVIYHAVASKMGNGYEDMPAYFAAGKPIGMLPNPQKVLDNTFLGWYTADGIKITEATIVNRDMQIYARWEKGNSPVDPKPDPGPTEPQPTEPKPTEPEAPLKPASFRDVKQSDWFYESVNYVSARNLMSGYGNGAFGPNDALTRAMLVKILYSHAGTPAVSGASSFRDVPKDAYYADAVAWAQEYGVVNGTSATTFSPDTRITREQIATILYRYCVKYLGVKAENFAEFDQFTDSGSVSDYAKEAFRWAVGNEIIFGVSKTKLEPQGTANRAQAATMLMRVIEQVL